MILHEGNDYGRQKPVYSNISVLKALAKRQIREGGNALIASSNPSVERHLDAIGPRDSRIYIRTACIQTLRDAHSFGAYQFRWIWFDDAKHYPALTSTGFDGEGPLCAPCQIAIYLASRLCGKPGLPLFWNGKEVR